MKKTLRNLENKLVASWFGILSMESIERHAPNLVPAFYGANINDSLICSNAFKQIAKTEFESMNEISQQSYRNILEEALTYSNDELLPVFKDSGMIFLTTVVDPHLFLVDLWNIVFQNQSTTLE
jgi:hypothetical protein